MNVKSTKKILLVEDDPDIISSLTVFMKNEGYLVDGADGQRTALEKIAQGQYDIVLLDISLNDGNGFSTCTAIKSQKDIPIIFLTANDDEFSVVSGLELGADDYISLSQDIDRLLHGEESIRFDDYVEGELAVLGNEISKMTLRLLDQSEQLRKDKNYLADSLADISHQLKTPLTSLEILNAALSQESIDEEQRSVLLQEQLSLLSRMEWLIAVLLKLSRLDAGTIEFEKKTFSMTELVGQATATFDVTLDIKNITMNICDLSGIQLCGDIKWLAEALSNVIKNCIESTPNGGQITISAEENAMYVKLCIMDNGSGIPKEDLPHLFERFYRGKNSGKNGVGIGLSLAKTTITQQNG